MKICCKSLLSYKINCDAIGRADPVTESGTKNLAQTPASLIQSLNGSVHASGGSSQPASVRSGLSVRNRAALVDSRPLKMDSDGESMERSLALLTAQYEKNNRSSVNSQVGSKVRGIHF